MILTSKYIQDENGVKFAPITTPNAIRWPDGSNLNEKLSAFDTQTNSDDVTISDMSLFASGMNIATTTYQPAPSVNLYQLDLTGLSLQSDGTKGKLEVTSTPNQSWFAVMNTCNTPVNDASIGTFATGYSERIVMPASTTDTFVIPADCNYILFAYNSNTAVFPTAISIITGNKSIFERIDDLEHQRASGSLSYTFNTDAFLQGCDRYSKYLTKICCAGDSLIANAIGGSISSSVDEGDDDRRPMRLLTNGVARRLYDYISWNKPIWRRLDHSDWTKSGLTAFTSSQMNTICQGTNPGLWKATSQGSYAEITIPQGYEHFALIVRLKSGNGTLNVTLNGGNVGTYTNPYYTSKVATNSVVNASVVPQYVARGLSSINTNSGTTPTGNIYHIVEYNNLPSGQANTLRFTTASATEVDIWGVFYWSGNTCVVMNIAQAGHTTSDLLNDHLPDELFAENYDAVLFEVTEMNNLRLSIAQTKTDLQTIITALRNMGVDHCFTSCNPLGLSIEHDTNFYTTYSNPSQLDVNNAVIELMKEKAEAFIDIFQYFRWHIERRGGTLVGGQGGLWYTWDGQHGDAAGVKLWFDALIKVIAHKTIMIENN